MDNEMLLKDFKTNIEFRMNESLRFVKKSLYDLNEEEIWLRPNESLNSIGNLLLHLCGNMRQYGIDSLLGNEDLRKRDLEFSAKSTTPKDKLLERFENTIKEVIEAMNSLSKDEILRIRSVQGFEFSGLGNLIHVTEHLSYHTGQIAFAVKMLKNKDLGFYDGFDLNIKNNNNAS